MCCGQGVVWPGMGRELYDNFPAARDAMDRIAACANWDVLALMDEPSVETIGLTRWQQPYLFLLEYAQWSLYRSLGLEPDLVCGHSLGELIALCFAGVYEPAVAWYILDIRSQHISDLESKAGRDMGMMAVYADEDVIADTLSRWPDIFVSNRNTPTQSILSGPRASLLEARRSLRKGHHPALLLNVTMAFHNPAMRVLRDLSFRRLMALSMRPARTPMLSCVTTGFYPDDQAGICNQIMDLDENTVHWVGSVRNMWQRDGIRHFLETGPQDTLCGLVREIEPGALCLSSSSRGHETEVVRRTLARLYALGHLPHARIRQAVRNWPLESRPEGTSPEAAPAQGPAPAEEAAGGGEVLALVRRLLGEACGRDPASIRTGMDLRFDLSLRSSSFPRLIEEAEKNLGISVSFEDLIHVATVGDLVRALAGRSGEAVPAEDEAVRPPLGSPALRPCLVRAEAGVAEGDAPRELALDPTQRLFVPDGHTVFALYGFPGPFAADLSSGVAPLGATFLVGGTPDGAQPACGEEGGHVLALCLPGTPADRALAGQGHVDVVLLSGAAAGALDGQAAAVLCRELLRCQCRVLVVLHADGADTAASLPLVPAADLEAALRGTGIRFLEIACDLAGASPWHGELGDFLARELACGTVSPVRWLSRERARQLPCPLLDNADRSPLVFPVGDPRESRHSQRLVTAAQFSADGEPALSDAMLAIPGLAGVAAGERILPVSFLVRAKLESACMLVPWLTPEAVADLNLHAVVGLRPGVVREARTVVAVQPWMEHDRAPVRMCRCDLSVRTLLESGRRSDRHARVSDALMLMSAGPRAVTPLWGDGDAGSGSSRDVAGWYRQHGIGPSLQLVESVEILADGTLKARLGDKSVIALEGVWQYHSELSAIEGAIQAARMAFAFAPSAHDGTYGLALVGLIRFGLGDWHSPRTLFLRRCWDSPSVVRFDVQVLDGLGQCLMTINHLEFDRILPASPAAGGGCRS